ncbi:MAG TPA: MAPEG family protein [Polyangia bacterium]|jgi:uncharacterized MAPEG superfamily protein|nr:MAPEG family protein [Polyangia bacterium]
MTTPILCLLGFTAWNLLLVGVIGTLRTVMVLRGTSKPTEFQGGVPHGGERYWRLNRAHINTAENLPAFATLVLVGTLLHVGSPRFHTLPVVILVARIVQSIAHIASGNATAVNVRFTAFITQMVCFFWMLVLILRTVMR